MCKVLKPSQQEAIRGLHQKGWSKRRIARELGIHRQTVNRYSEGVQNVPAFRSPARARNRIQSVAPFRPRLGECGWEGTGSLDRQSFGPQELV